jgi:hypothetical protein
MGDYSTRQKTWLKNYEKPILILEGQMNKVLKRSKMKPASIYGAISSIILDFNFSIIPTEDPDSTSIIFGEGIQTKLLEIIQEKGKKLKLIQMHKAGINIAVASASILARARFLEKLSQLSTKFEMNFPKGTRFRDDTDPKTGQKVKVAILPDGTELKFFTDMLDIHGNVGFSIPSYVHSN